MTNLKAFKWLAIFEGISYLTFGLTMPLKYIYEIPQPNYVVGLAHGVLFIGYCVYAVIVAKDEKWSFGTTFLVLLASLLPFATFVVDAKLISPAIKQKL